MHARRLALATLSVAGVLDSLYMLAYHEGLIDSLVCPFFGDGCNVVGRSEHARHFGVPNAAVGALGYAAIGALALWNGRPGGERRWRSRALAILTASAVGAGLFLTWEQKAKVRAWCFWCLLSMALSTAMLPLALAEARR